MKNLADLSLDVVTAVEADLIEIARLRTAVAEDLSRQFGHGHWSSVVTVNSVRRGMRHARVLIVRADEAIAGTLRLATRKPWAIDRRHFVDVEQPLYLTDMAVAPDCQRQGIGRLLIAHAKEAARGWPAGSIRLDAYDGLAGAGPFYERCEFAEVGRVSYRGVPLKYYEWLATAIH
jgi:GNAT superfamily N-acetyltransferase